MVIIETEYGNIKIKLDKENAPLTGENFEELAKRGFYDNLTFHRVIEGFMIQGGCPKGNGTGGSGKNIIGEFSANGWVNNLSHKRGVISMARASGFNTASSQFFIVHRNSEFLDGQYAAFGEVVEGMEVVDKIASCDTDSSDKPKKPQVIKKIYVEEE